MKNGRLLYAVLPVAAAMCAWLYAGPAHAGEQTVDDKIAQYIATITSKDAEFDDKASAMKKLAALGEPAVPEILRALPGADPTSQTYLLIALAGVKDRSLLKRREVDQLIKLLDSKSFPVRYWTVKNLATAQDKQALPPLIKALQAPDLFTQRVALGALVGRKVKQAADDIVPLLQHDNTQLRVDAAMGLKALGDAKHVEKLIPLLSDDDMLVVLAGAEAIEGISNEKLGIRPIDTDEQVRAAIGKWLEAWRKAHPATP